MHQKSDGSKEMLKKTVKECIFNAPLLLIDLYNKNKQVKKIVDHYIPLSVGIEVETFRKVSYKSELFQRIPKIMEVRVNHEEQRYRIPPGINGLICLYLITRETKNHCELDTKGSIHYHIDMTTIFDIVNEKFIDQNRDWILKELDSWGKIDDNERNILIDTRCWVNMQTTYKTMEIRIGDMSFDYNYLVKKILHCSSIVRRVYESYNKPLPEDNSRIVSVEEIQEFNNIAGSRRHNIKLETLKTEKEKIIKKQKESKEDIKEQEIEKIVNKRVIRI